MTGNIHRHNNARHFLPSLEHAPLCSAVYRNYLTMNTYITSNLTISTKSDRNLRQIDYEILSPLTLTSFHRRY